MTDTRLFEAIRKFQADKKLPVTGAIRPHDDTIAAINRAIEDQPIAQKYIWRTCQDDRVRSSHDALEGQVRSWLQSPLPGQEANCRCWAEPVKKGYTNKQLQTPGIDKIGRLPDWEIPTLLLLMGGPATAPFRRAALERLKEWRFEPTRDKLQHIYDEHATAFGITAPINNQTLELLKQTIQKHIQNSNTHVRKGEYHKEPVIHYYDPKTGLNVMRELDGKPISGWKLNPKQRMHMEKNGKLGGNKQ